MKRETQPKQFCARSAREKIDVIVAGALEKEVVLHPFLGNVARRLVREAPCSVMLFTTPAANPKPMRRIVFVADYSEVRVGGFEKDAAARCGGIMRAALCYSDHHDV